MAASSASTSHAALTPQCTEAIPSARMGQLMPEVGQHPGMSEAEIAELADDKDTDRRHPARAPGDPDLGGGARPAARTPDIAVSGRLTLKQSNGQRVVEWKASPRSRKQFQVPTLLLDATLPEKPVLQVYHPQVEVVADIRVALPARSADPAGARTRRPRRASSTTRRISTACGDTSCSAGSRPGAGRRW